MMSKRHNSRVVKKPVRRTAVKPKRRILPGWMPILTVVTLCTMLVLTINYRAFSDLTKETREFEVLNNKITAATTDNLSLQEEIHYLKNDPNMIEREARKYGLAPPKEQVSRAGDIDKAEKSINRQPPTKK